MTPAGRRRKAKAGRFLTLIPSYSQRADGKMETYSALWILAKIQNAKRRSREEHPPHLHSEGKGQLAVLQCSSNLDYSPCMSMNKLTSRSSLTGVEGKEVVQNDASVLGLGTTL